MRPPGCFGGPCRYPLFFSRSFPAERAIGGYPLFLFYNTIPNLLVYNTGELKFSDFPKVGFALCTAAAIIYCITAVTYWKWLGLFAL